MRTRYHTRNPAWSVNLSDTPMPTAPVQTFALELPIEQRAAFVFLRKLKDGTHSAAAAVMRRLDAEKVAFRGVFAELRQEGYVTFEGTGHRLTPKGLFASNDIIKDFCFRYSIHVFTLSGGRGSGGGTWCRCSCGTWSTGPHNNDRFGESRIRTAQASHIKDVESGVWPTRTLTEHMNRVKPLTLDLTSGSPPSFPQGVGGPDPGAVVASVSAAAPGNYLVQANTEHGEAPSRSPGEL